MNYAVIGRILSWVLRTEGLLMLLPCLIALIYGEWQGLVYLALGVGAIAAGWLLSRKKIANPAIYQREGFVSVGLSWVVLSLYGAIPFVITGEIPVFLDALFEIVSGFRRQVLPYWPMWRRSLIQACFGGAFPTGLAGWASWSSFS